MSMELPKEINGVYTFECDDHTYAYRTMNVRKYSNQEFMNILRTSHKTFDYYKAMFPREEAADWKFLENVRIILKYTKSEQKKELINDILNNCLIIDEEPTLLGDKKLFDENVYFTNVKERGSYHIDRCKLHSFYRDAINYVAHKYIKEYNSKNHYTDKEEKNLELLAKLN